MRVLAKTKDMPVDEWRKLRKGSLGGSDASAVLGLNEYKSVFALYADKKGLIPDSEDSEETMLGGRS